MKEIGPYEEQKNRVYQSFSLQVEREAKKKIDVELRLMEERHLDQIREYDALDMKYQKDNNLENHKEIRKKIDYCEKKYEDDVNRYKSLISKLSAISDLRDKMECVLDAYDEILTAVRDITTAINKTRDEKDRQADRELKKIYHTYRSEEQVIIDKYEAEVNRLFEETRDLISKIGWIKSVKLDIVPYEVRMNNYDNKYIEDQTVPMTLEQSLDTMQNHNIRTKPRDETKQTVRNNLEKNDIPMSITTEQEVETVEAFKKYNLDKSELVIKTDKQYSPYKLAVKASKSVQIISKDDRKLTAISAAIQTIQENQKTKDFQKTLELLTKMRSKLSKHMYKEKENLHDNGYSVIQDTVELKRKLEEEIKQRERFEEERRLNELREDELRQKRYEQLFSFDDDQRGISHQ